MVVNGFIFQPDKYLLPAYKISPFSTPDVARNCNLPFSCEVDDYFRERFAGRRFVYCENGRQALHLALQSVEVTGPDAVTVLTTTGNHYISGCVTREVEKFCGWSREIEKNTKAVLVNHEFGFPFEQLQALRRFGLPIIEDAAHSFASDNTENTVGRVGEFLVYSFPKFFPIQIGGLLVFDGPHEVEELVDAVTKKYIQKVLSHHLRDLPSACRKRGANYRYLAARFETIGCAPRFELTERSVPGVFMFKTKDSVVLGELKKFMWEQGVESSVFYGEQAFFLPVHERLEQADLDFFFEVFRTFINERGRQGMDLAEAGSNHAQGGRTAQKQPQL